MSPLTAKGEEIMSAMRKSYPSEEKAKEVFYASKNAGTISGVDAIAAQTTITDNVSPGPGLDAVLNWGGGVNNETVLSGGQGDKPGMPTSATAATAIGASRDGLPELKKELGKFIEQEEREKEHK